MVHSVIYVVQNGISDEESHSHALKILLIMGEYFQIQVTQFGDVYFIIVLVLITSGV